MSIYAHKYYIYVTFVMNFGYLVFNQESQVILDRLILDKVFKLLVLKLQIENKVYI